MFDFTKYLPQNRWNMIVCCGAILLTISSLIALCISLQAAYLWLIVVFMTVLFFTTFTCSPQPQIQQLPQPNENVPTCNNQPVWIIDLPPTYTHATGLPSGMTPPPSYKNVHLYTSIYERKRDSTSSIFNINNNRYKRHGSVQSEQIPEFFPRRCNRQGSLQIEHLPEVFSNKFDLHKSRSSSVQTLHFDVIENHRANV